MTNRETYDRIFIETLGLDSGQLGAGLTFADTPQWDSLAHLELVSALEDAFDVMLEPDEITHFGGYGHGVEVLRAHGVEVA